MMLLVNPTTGDAISVSTATEFTALVREGWKPVGPKGQALQRREAKHGIPEEFLR